jgi:hypothetical protein
MSFLDNNPLSFIFGTKPGAGVPTYEQLQMRRKIAESLLGQRSKFPKTFGEGLSAIGEAIGERGMMNRLDSMESAKGAQDKATIDAIDAPAGPTPAAPMGRPMSYAPTDTAAPPTTLGSNVGNWNQFAQEQSPGGLGLTPPQAAGLVGNLQAESGANINPNAPPGDQGTAFGSAQWRGPRLAALQQYAARQGLDPMTTAAQQGFMRQEMIGQGNRMPTEGGAYAGLTATNTPAGAATAVDRLYERSSGEHRGRRIDNAQKIMRGLGPQSGVVDPALNQSVALNPTEPAAPTGPPTAFSGVPASDAPPVGIPMSGQAAPPPDARAAIAGALAPKPPPVVAPPVAPPPAGPQIAQAPPQQQIRVPDKEPTPPPAPVATEKMRRIEKALSTIGDPLQRDVLTKRYQQEWLDQQSIYNQKLEEYKYKRQKYDTAPEKAVALDKAQQDLTKSKLEADVAARTGGLGNEPLIAPVVESQKKVANIPSSMQSLKEARAALAAGTYTGAGAEQKLAIAKTKAAVAGLFGIDANDPRIANTEAYRANITPLVAQARAATVGNANISDADIRLALQAAGGALNLDKDTYPKVLDALERVNVGLAIGHQGKVVAAAAGNETAAKALHGVYGLPMEAIVPPRIIQHLKEHPDTAAEFDKTFKTPGLARKILGQ